MITYEKLRVLVGIHEKAYRSLQAGILGNSYKKEDYLEAYKNNYTLNFVEEFKEVVINNLSKTIELKHYVEDVYYNEIGLLYMKFRELGNFYFEGSKERKKSLSRGENILFNKISKHACTLRYLSEMIYIKAKRHGIAELKHHLFINKSDYGLLGYKALIPVDKSTLKEIFDPGAIDMFIEIEQRLKNENYFAEDGTWVKSLDECAALIMLLYKNGFFNKRRNKNVWITKSIKPLFENRYKVKFTKQMQPAYRESKKLSCYLNWIEQVVR